MTIKNDHKGETISESGARVVFASGQRRTAPDARSDGRGGLLDRGYWRLQGLDRKGPFSCRNAVW